jgi:hypothetical protein
MRTCQVFFYDQATLVYVTCYQVIGKSAECLGMLFSSIVAPGIDTIFNTADRFGFNGANDRDELPSLVQADFEKAVRQARGISLASWTNSGLLVPLLSSLIPGTASHLSSCRLTQKNLQCKTLAVGRKCRSVLGVRVPLQMRLQTQPERRNL